MEDWAACYFAMRDQLFRLALKRYAHAGEADGEEAFNFAEGRLFDRGWEAIASGYRGRGAPEGYLRTTFVRELENFRRRFREPRCRPPGWVKDLGDSWVSTFKRLCCLRELKETVVNAVGVEYGVEPEGVLTMIRQIRGRHPTCGQQHPAIESHDPQDPLFPQSEDEDDPQERERQRIAAALAFVFDPHLEVSPDDPWLEQRDVALIEEVRMAVARVDLTNEDLLFLRLVYEEGLDFSKAGRRMGMEPRPASRLHSRVMKKLSPVLKVLLKRAEDD